MLDPNWLGRLAAYHPERPAVWFRGAWISYGASTAGPGRRPGSSKAWG